MAVGIYFTPSLFTPDKYDESMRQLEATGAGWPDGCSHHVALERNGEIQFLFDIWESQAAFEEFMARLSPILTELGVDLGEPMVARVHNVGGCPGL